MKRSEVIKCNIKQLADHMCELYRTVLEYYGRIEYKVYIWSDGEVEVLEDVQGSSTYLKANDGETRDLYYVTTVSAPLFDPWDFTDHAAPDDETEREAERKEILDFMEYEYRNERVSDILSDVIEQAESEEAQEEEYDRYMSGNLED